VYKNAGTEICREAISTVVSRFVEETGTRTVCYFLSDFKHKRGAYSGFSLYFSSSQMGTQKKHAKYSKNPSPSPSPKKSKCFRKGKGKVVPKLN
jgi:hypothetical protein